MVRPGYKQTEVGEIPEDWYTEATANLVETTSPICYGVVQVGQNTNNGVPIVAIKFVKDIAHAPLHRASIELELPYIRSRVKAGDVLISIKGTIGRVGIVPSGFEGNISRELARLRLKESFTPGYIANQLEAGGTQERISRAIVGTTRLEFSIASLRRFELPMPPTIGEQQAIAEALSDVDNLIAGQEKLIAKKQDIKTATMQQLLTGRTRLPGFGKGKGFKQTELGVIPEDWEVKLLPNVCHFRGGKAHEKYISDLGRFLCVNSKFISTNGKVHKKSTTNFCCAKLNDILMVMSDLPNGKALAKAFFTNRANLYAVNQRVCALTPLRDCSRYLFYVLNRNPYFLKFNDGVNQTHLLNHVFQKCPLLLPSTKAEQEAIATILSDIEKEIETLQTRLSKTKAIKQGMMQELLTGRTRLI